MLRAGGASMVRSQAATAQGYYNTVGSLEGWNPSTFKSSREERLKQK